jgi:hypothetical protein
VCFDRFIRDEEFIRYFLVTVSLYKKFQDVAFPFRYPEFKHEIVKGQTARKIDFPCYGNILIKGIGKDKKQDSVAQGILLAVNNCRKAEKIDPVLDNINKVRYQEDGSTQ